MALYHKYRPKTLDEVVGLDATVSVVNDILYKRKEGERPQTYLLTGPAGTGKTTLAQIMARELGIHEMFVTVINCANQNGIDMVRGIEERMRSKPYAGKGKAYILDECHELTTPAKEALLKPTEDTPPGVYFFLCTTDPHALISQLLTRCTVIQTQPLDSKPLFGLIMGVAVDEEIPVTKKVVDRIIDISEGSARQALVFLDMIRDMQTDTDMLGALKSVAVTEAEVKTLCQLLVRGAGWGDVSEVLKGMRKANAESIRRAVLGYATSVALNSKSPNPRAMAILEAFEEPTYNIGFPGIVMSCLGCSNDWKL